VRSRVFDAFTWEVSHHGIPCGDDSPLRTWGRPCGLYRSKLHRSWGGRRGWV